MGSRLPYLRREYGINVEQFDRMFEAQGSVCAICGKDDAGRAWSVDHDHVTGAIRGVLCWHCNIGLGHFRDNPDALEAAITYLSNHARVARAS